VSGRFRRKKLRGGRRHVRAGQVGGKKEHQEQGGVGEGEGGREDGSYDLRAAGRRA